MTHAGDEHRPAGRVGGGRRGWRPACAGAIPALAVVIAAALAGACQSVAEGTDWRDVAVWDVDPDVGAVLTWLPAPDVPTAATLYAAWGSQEYDLWVVGAEGTVLRRGSAGWEPIAVPTGARLEAIVGFGAGPGGGVVTDLFVVGAGGTVLRRGLTPASPGPDAGPDPDSGAGADAGAAPDTGPAGPVWTLEPVPTDRDLLDVHGTAPDDLWAVGAEGVVLHRGPEGWAEVPTGHLDRLGGVLAFRPDAAVAVGDFGTVLRWDGERWRRDPDVGTARHLNAVWGTGPDDLVVVGLGGTVLRWRDGAWTRLTAETAGYLRDVWGASGRLVYAVGWDGTVVRIEGELVTTIVPDERHRLEGIFGGVGPHTFFVGADGAVLVGPQPPAGWGAGGGR